MANSAGLITNLDEAKELIADLSKSVEASRLRRSELMDVLSSVYRIRLNTDDSEKWINHIIQSRKLEGANRAYVMKKSNGFTLPLRYIFTCQKDRSNVSRYAGALDQLCKLGIAPQNFKTGIQENGGITQLYWMSRDRENKAMRRNSITLDRNIEFLAGQVIYMTLKPNANGVFQVLEHEVQEAKIAAE